MLPSLLQVLVFLLIIFSIPEAVSYTLTYDSRSFLIDGNRILFIGGSFHYPRAPRSEWSHIFTELKNHGVNLIQTYVFWDIHEPTEGDYSFPTDEDSNYNLIAFVQEAAKQGFYVNLRISGYICAEWNFGGIPVWLRQKRGVLRSFNLQWLESLKKFVAKTLSVVRDAKLLAADNGPIVMLQIENEYGDLESNYGAQGARYINYLTQWTMTLDTRGALWTMCQQGEGHGTPPPPEIINTCNGFYCDNWIAEHQRAFPNQPHMWTENWPGWFQRWGEPVPHRPAIDISFSVARWFAKGGSYVNYYMAYGGTNYGRTVGGPSIVTSYDYDVSVNEYGFRTEPKYTLLSRLHQVMSSHAGTLFAQAPPTPSIHSDDPSCEIHLYEQPTTETITLYLVFMSNIYNDGTLCTFDLSFLFPKVYVLESSTTKSITVPSWSVSIATGSSAMGVTLQYNTRSDAETIPISSTTTANLLVDFADFQIYKEPIPPAADVKSSLVPHVWTNSPKEQLSLTNDTTDYLWYTTSLEDIKLASSSDVHQLTFTVGTSGGGLVFVFVDGKLVGSNLNKWGGPPSPTKKILTHIHNSHNVQTQGLRGGRHLINYRESPSDSVLEPHNSVDPGITVNMSISLPARTLSILSVSMGLKNYAAFYDQYSVGIISPVSVNGAQLTGFIQSVGLVGEANQIYNGFDSIRSNSQWPMTTDKDCTNILCWYETTFKTPSSIVLSLAGYSEKKLMNEKLNRKPLSLALDMGAVNYGKGSVWLNGHMLGRLWSVVAVESPETGYCTGSTQCQSEKYSGPYSPEQCRTGCGLPSQTLYKIQLEWLKSDDSANTLVFLVEPSNSNHSLTRVLQPKIVKVCVTN